MDGVIYRESENTTRRFYLLPTVHVEIMKKDKIILTFGWLLFWLEISFSLRKENLG